MLQQKCVLQRTELVLCSYPLVKVFPLSWFLYLDSSEKLQINLTGIIKSETQSIINRGFMSKLCLHSSSKECGGKWGEHLYISWEMSFSNSFRVAAIDANKQTKQHPTKTRKASNEYQRIRCLQKVRVSPQFEQRNGRNLCHKLEDLSPY